MNFSYTATSSFAQVIVESDGKQLLLVKGNKIVREVPVYEEEEEEEPEAQEEAKGQGQEGASFAKVMAFQSADVQSDHLNGYEEGNLDDEY